jgi:hypothetical protein
LYWSWHPDLHVVPVPASQSELFVHCAVAAVNPAQFVWQTPVAAFHVQAMFVFAAPQAVESG